MANKVLLKKSSVSGKIPQTTDLDYGELALNYTDGILYYKNNENIIRTFSDDYNRPFITAGDDIVGAIKYNGTTKTDGQMYGGTSTPTNTTRLNYDGHLYATEMFAINFDSTSDQRAKTNIVTIDNALEKTLQLRGVEFDWKESGQHAIGVIAQEVEQIIPEVVNDNGELKSVSYGNIVGLLIEAIKEQQKQIEELQNKIK